MEQLAVVDNPPPPPALQKPDPYVLSDHSIVVIGPVAYRPSGTSEQILAGGDRNTRTSVLDHPRITRRPDICNPFTFSPFIMASSPANQPIGGMPPIVYSARQALLNIRESILTTFPDMTASRSINPAYAHVGTSQPIRRSGTKEYLIVSSLVWLAERLPATSGEFFAAIRVLIGLCNPDTTVMRLVREAEGRFPIQQVESRKVDLGPDLERVREGRMSLRSMIRNDHDAFKAALPAGWSLVHDEDPITFELLPHLLLNPPKDTSKNHFETRLEYVSGDRLGWRLLDVRFKWQLLVQAGSRNRPNVDSQNIPFELFGIRITATPIHPLDGTRKGAAQDRAEQIWKAMVDLAPSRYLYWENPSTFLLLARAVATAIAERDCEAPYESVSNLSFSFRRARLMEALEHGTAFLKAESLALALAHYGAERPAAKLAQSYGSIFSAGWLEAALFGRDEIFERARREHSGAARTFLWTLVPSDLVAHIRCVLFDVDIAVVRQLADYSPELFFSKDAEPDTFEGDSGFRARRTFEYLLYFEVVLLGTHPTWIVRRIQQAKWPAQQDLTRMRTELRVREHSAVDLNLSKLFKLIEQALSEASEMIPTEMASVIGTLSLNKIARLVESVHRRHFETNE